MITNKLKNRIGTLKRMKVTLKKSTLFLFIHSLILLLSCDINEKNSLHKASNTEINIAKDSIIIDSLLFSSKYNLKYWQNNKPFKLSSDANNQHYKAKAKIENNIITYKIDLKRNDIKSKFNWQDEDDYAVNDMSIGINDKFIDISNLNFDNISTRKLYPSGNWHWAVEDCSVKYTFSNGKEYFFINGANLYCNGHNCNGYQLYIIVKEDNKLTFSALEYDDLIPYYFHEMKLFDKNSDGIPEFYLPFGAENKSLDINNFEKYSFDLDNKIIKI